MKYICPKCTTSFDDKMALCESRRDKDRCFGCPTCQTFYRKELIYPKLNRKILIPSIFLTVITTIFAVSAITQSKLWALFMTPVTSYLSYLLVRKLTAKPPRVELHLVDR